MPRYEAVGARRAYKTRNTFCLRTNKAFPEIPLERGTINFFLCQKEKRLQKRSWQPCRLTACAHQLSRKKISCSQRCCASDGGFTYTRNQEVGICRFTNERLRFDGRGACPSSSREPRNTNRMGLRSTIRGNFDQMDAGVRRRGFTAPTWGFVPAVWRRKASLRLDADHRPVGGMNFGSFVGDDGLAAARSRSGSDDHSGRHSLPSRRFATPASRIPSADGTKPLSGKGVAGVSLTG